MNDIRAGNSDNDYERGREGGGRNLITTIPIVKPLFPINTTIPQYIYIPDIDSLSFVKIDSKIGRLNLRPGLRVRLTIEISFRKIDRFEIHKQCPNERARTRAWILKVCVRARVFLAWIFRRKRSGGNRRSPSKYRTRLASVSLPRWRRKVSVYTLDRPIPASTVCVVSVSRGPRSRLSLFDFPVFY